MLKIKIPENGVHREVCGTVGEHLPVKIPVAVRLQCKSKLWRCFAAIDLSEWFLPARFTPARLSSPHLLSSITGTFISAVNSKSSCWTQ